MSLIARLERGRAQPEIDARTLAIVSDNPAQPPRLQAGQARGVLKGGSFADSPTIVAVAIWQLIERSTFVALSIPVFSPCITGPTKSMARAATG
jgi:hypothetical protein